MTVMANRPTRLPCGTNAAYRRGCRCADCRRARLDAYREWESSKPRSRGIVEARQRIDELNVEAFVNGDLDHTQTTPAERKAAARVMDARGISRNDIARRTRLNSTTLWRVFRADEPAAESEAVVTANESPWARLYVSPPAAEPECVGATWLFVDKWDGNTRHLMRDGAPDVWARTSIAEAFAMCARCPVRDWCVAATAPESSKVTIIAGGTLWHDGVAVWTLAQQEALEVAQDESVAS